MNSVLQKLVSVFLSKKRVIGWISAIVMVAGAAAASMSSEDFKAAVCGAPLVDEGK